ncbi:Fe-S cluster assembly protein SufB, partial [Candidatus Parvarchaeota archaeon]|nr:Fe-S cluster assembly protein SufB [Candidatus Parvarchaeota archaeon]
VKKYFMTRCVPCSDNKFAALHGAVWSGGSFVYVPKNIKVQMPLQIYFLMNHPAFGQYEHTLIIADEGSDVQYIEGCSAPMYTEKSVHSAVVEIFVHKGAKVRYTSIQNWSKNVYNLNTKRAIVEENGLVEWVGGTLGSGLTMLYPCSMLVGRGARAEHMNVAFAGEGQIKDNGAKVIHLAPNTTSTVVSKSICKQGGWTNYRGLLSIAKGCVGSKSSVRCDALMLDGDSKSSTMPYMDIRERKVTVGHEATAGRISDEQLFYLQTRGLTKDEATALIVRGFIEPITKRLPLEYAVEFNRMIELEMEGKGVVG